MAARVGPDRDPQMPRFAPRSVDVGREQVREERVALIAGASVALLGALAWLLLALSRPDGARALGAQWAAQILLGKETGIPAGLAAGNPPMVIILAGFAQDAVILLLGYGLFLRAIRGAVRNPWLARRLTRLAGEPARASRGMVGIPLLALTIWIPFLPTGALVAAILGRSAGYAGRALLPALAASILLSHVAYTTLYAAALRFADARALLVTAAAIAVLMSAWFTWRARRRRSTTARVP